MDKYDQIMNVLSGKRLDGFLVTDILNIRYLTGFGGSTAMLFVGKDNVFFFTDFRYKYECENLLKTEEPVIVKKDFFSDIRRSLKSFGVRKLGFEYGASYQVFDKLRKAFQLRPMKDVVEKLRMIKGEEELKNIRLAVRRAEKAFKSAKRWIRAGISERKVAAVLEHNLKEEGCRKLPFDIIVASGKNSALPHARITDKKIQRGDFVVIDWGGEAGGYMSDMTRTLLIRGDALGNKKRIYETVLEANKKAIHRSGSGMLCRDVDGTAREVITKRGYGDYFGHSTGHGVGLNVHEAPSLSPRSKDVLHDGVVFTVEPGVYMPEIGGVRIEDMVMIKEGKGKCLTTLPKSLAIL